MQKTRVLIADDHAIVRIGLAALLNAKSDIEVVGQAKDGRTAVTETLRLNPDVVIMDLMMPIMDGTAATAEITARRPGVKVIILTTFSTSDGIKHALDAGAVGALMKNEETDSLVDAIRKVSKGETVISPDVEALIRQDPPAAKLTPKQSKVLESLIRGLTNKDIAKILGITEGSVEEHVNAIFIKLGAANRTEAVAIALRKHLLKI